MGRHEYAVPLTPRQRHVCGLLDGLILALIVAIVLLVVL